VSTHPSATCLVTGGAGFIGSHLIDALLADPATAEVRVLDNFSSGRREHLAPHAHQPRLKVHEVDLLNLPDIAPCFAGVDQVIHLAANPDARWGIGNTRLDLEQETIATYNVLEAMRRANVPRILFSSSGTVYGDVGTTVTRETLGPCLPVSLYGAGKVASEALISGFGGTFGLCGVIYRFGNIVGERTTHGVIYDFIRQLVKDPSRLTVLGNGYQAKPYVYVRDLVAGLLFGKTRCGQLPGGQVEVFNLAPDGATSVRFIAGELLRQLGLAERTQVQYGDTPQGWPGDVAQSRMDAAKLRQAGFGLPRTSDEAVSLAIRQILEWLAVRPESPDGLKLPAGVQVSFEKP
jgi:UDP-glucose 4-epimerase